MTILGCITKYQPNDIRPYVESIARSEFSGRKVMLIYDVPQETIDYLKRHGWELYGNKLQQHIIIQRFRDIYKLLEGFDKDEIIIWADVKDVIFQKDPTNWIKDNFSSDKYIMAFSECIKLKDDPWACINSGTTFPLEWEWNKVNISYCAGTMVGEVEFFRDLFIQIYHWSLTTSNNNQLADQAAYNILIRLNPIKNIIQFVEQEEGFVTQMGDVYIKKDQLGDVLLEPTPMIDNEGWVFNQKGEKFCLVHQYDRDPILKEKISQRYK